MISSYGARVYAKKKKGKKEKKKGRQIQILFC